MSGGDIGSLYSENKLKLKLNYKEKKLEVINQLELKVYIKFNLCVL